MEEEDGSADARERQFDHAFDDLCHQIQTQSDHDPAWLVYKVNELFKSGQDEQAQQKKMWFELALRRKTMDLIEAKVDQPVDRPVSAKDAANLSEPEPKRTRITRSRSKSPRIESYGSSGQTLPMPVIDEHPSLRRPLCIDSSSMPRLQAFFDVVIAASAAGHIEDSLPLVLLEDLFELQPIHPSCAVLFDLLISRVDKLTSQMVPTRGKGLVLLKLLNSLLRRLSRGKKEDNIFSGRVLVFLASVFPLGERSGLNLRGEFNTDNKTTFGSGSPGSDGDDFYSLFWSIQDYFADPKLIFQDTLKTDMTTAPKTRSSSPDLSRKHARTPEPPQTGGTAISYLAASRQDLTPLGHLKRGIETTLSKFREAQPIEGSQSVVNGVQDLSGVNSIGNSRPTDQPQMDNNFRGQKTDTYFPKFLTSEALFPLEIADASFRRHILIQFLILFDYLRGFSNVEKLKWAKVKPMSKSFQVGQYTLSDEDTAWIAKQEESTYALLGKEDSSFRQALRIALDHEKNWIRWKWRGCSAFDKPPLSVSQPDWFAKSKEGHERLSRPIAPLAHLMGRESLAKLWTYKREKGLSLETLKAETLAEAKAYESSDSDRLLAHLKDFGSRVMRTELRISQKRRQIAKGESRESAGPAGEEGSKSGMPTPLNIEQLRAIEVEIASLEETKQSLTWRALRLGSREYLNLYDKIGTGDLSELIRQIERSTKVEETPETAGAADSNGKSAEAALVQDAMLGAEQSTKIENTQVASAALPSESDPLPVLGPDSMNGEKADVRGPDLLMSEENSADPIHVERPKSVERQVEMDTLQTNSANAAVPTEASPDSKMSPEVSEMTDATPSAATTLPPESETGAGSREEAQNEEP